MTQTVAERAAAAMWSGDGASRWFGFRIAEVAEGTAALTLLVEPHHCNGHGMLHGGVTFALADSAFAFACNTYNQRTVAQMAAVSFLAPAFEGDLLTATAQEVWRQGRGGIYDVRVTNQSGTPIAEFRGHSRTVKGTHLPEPTE